MGIYFCWAKVKIYLYHLISYPNKIWDNTRTCIFLPLPNDKGYVFVLVPNFFILKGWLLHLRHGVKLETLQSCTKPSIYWPYWPQGNHSNGSLHFPAVWDSVWSPPVDTVLFLQVCWRPSLSDGTLLARFHMYYNTWGRNHYVELTHWPLGDFNDILDK